MRRQDCIAGRRQGVRVVYGPFALVRQEAIAGQVMQAAVIEHLGKTKGDAARACLFFLSGLLSPPNTSRTSDAAVTDATSQEWPQAAFSG